MLSFGKPGKVRPLRFFPPFFSSFFHIHAPVQGLLVNFDCCALWVSDAEPLKAALSLTPEFLRAAGNTLDYKAHIHVLSLSCLFIVSVPHLPFTSR